jgi:thiol:disulfide interchange protein DsbD
MIKKGFLLLFFWTLLIQSQSPEQVVWTTALEKVSDDTYLLKFKAKIKPKWHLYSQNLPDNGPLPTEFIFKGDEGQFDLVGSTQEGKSKTAYDPIFEMELSWFDGEAQFEQKIKLLNPDLVSIEGEINYQACDDKLCIFRNEAFLFVLNKSKQVIREKKVIDTGSLEKISALKIDLKNKQFIDQKEQKNTDNSLLNLFLLGFIGGIIALLTPCIFPMIPLTVSFFLKQSTIKGKGLGRALLYSFFILVIYILSSLPFHFLDAIDPQILNTISTNIVMNLIFFVVFVFFAFSFFGYYEITLPSSWGNFSDSASSSGGVLGLFFMALTLAIVSFSCTGPILGSLLVGSLTADGEPRN